MIISVDRMIQTTQKSKHWRKITQSFTESITNVITRAFPEHSRKKINLSSVVPKQLWYGEWYDETSLKS